MKKKLIVRECTCPVCGSSMVNYGSSDLNDNIMSYIHMLINSYTVTQKTPTFPIITNYIKNTKFNLKQKEDILKNKSNKSNAKI